MAIPGMRFVKINTGTDASNIPLKQWNKLLKEDQCVICSHSQTKHVVLITINHLEEAKQAGYEPIPIASIESIVRKLMQDDSQLERTIRKSEDLLKALKQREISHLKQNPYPSISTDSPSVSEISEKHPSPDQSSSLYQFLAKITPYINAIKELPEENLQIFDSIANDIQFLCALPDFLQTEDLDRIRTALGNFQVLIKHAYQLEQNSEWPEIYTFDELTIYQDPLDAKALNWIGLRLTIEQIYSCLGELLASADFASVLPQVEQEIYRSKNERTKKLEWLSFYHPDFVQSMKSLEVYLNQVLSHPPQNSEDWEPYFQEIISRIPPNFPDSVRIFFYTVQNLKERDKVYSLVAQERLLNGLIDSKYHITRVEQFVKKNALTILNKFQPIIPRSWLNKTEAADIEVKIDLADQHLEGHHGGKTVCIVQMSCGGEQFKFVCKPREAKIDKAVIDIFRVINTSCPLELPLPTYLIVNPKEEPSAWNLEVMEELSLWEFVEGTRLDKVFNERSSAQAFLNQLEMYQGHVTLEDKDLILSQESIQKLKNRLKRMNAIMAALHVTDLHVQNLIVSIISNNPLEVDLIPIDLEIVDSTLPTMLRIEEKYELNTKEKDCVAKFNTQGKIVRVLPFDTQIFATLITDCLKNLGFLTKMITNVIQALNKTYNIEDERHNILLKSIINSILHKDIPFLTELNGNLYYGFPKQENYLGKRGA